MVWICLMARSVITRHVVSLSQPCQRSSVWSSPPRLPLLSWELTTWSSWRQRRSKETHTMDARWADKAERRITWLYTHQHKHTNLPFIHYTLHVFISYYLFFIFIKQTLWLFVAVYYYYYYIFFILVHFFFLSWILNFFRFYLIKFVKLKLRNWIYHFL